MNFSPSISFLWSLIFYYVGGALIENNNSILMTLGAIFLFFGLASGVYFSKASVNIRGWIFTIAAVITCFFSVFMVNNIFPDADIWTDMIFLAPAAVFITATGHRFIVSIMA